MLTRRELCLLALSFPVLAPAKRAEAAVRLRGPMVGHVGPNRALIWAYTKNQPGAFVDYRVEGSPRSTARRVPIVPARGHRAVLTGLVPSTTYVYRVSFRGRSDDQHWRGRFRTPPSVGTPHKFRLVTSSCMKPKKFQGAWLEAFKFNPDFHLLLGDNAYVDSTSTSAHWEDNLRMRGVWQFAQFVRNTPTYAIWDDHDFAGNDSGGQAVPQRARILSTFKELWPNPSFGAPGIPGAFFKLSRGDVDFFVLDGRYYRTPRKAPDDARKRMLGDAQFAWFEREIRRSKACFKLIATGSTIDAKDTDIWKEYSFALKRVYRAIREHRIGGVMWLTGDLHDSRITVHPKADTGFYDMVEVVSSGIANGAHYRFAVLDFDTTLEDPSVRVRIQDGHGGQQDDRTFRLSAMQVGPN